MGGRDIEQRLGGRNRFRGERGSHQHVLVIGPRGEWELVTPEKAEKLIQKRGWKLGQRKD